MNITSTDLQWFLKKQSEKSSILRGTVQIAAQKPGLVKADLDEASLDLIKEELAEQIRGFIYGDIQRRALCLRVAAFEAGTEEWMVEQLDEILDLCGLDVGLMWTKSICDE